MRYIKTFAGVLLYLFFCVLALLPVLAIRTTIESSSYAIAVVIWATVSFLFLFPALAVIIKKSWLYKGKGEPVTIERLRGILLEINDFNAPVSVREHRKKLVITWRYEDQDWCELLEKTEAKQLYELWLGFDGSTRTVTMSDRYRSVNWSLSPIQVKTGIFAFSRPYFDVSTGIVWGVENYVDSRPEDYTFSPTEIKSPILNTIIRNGWNVRFSLF